MTRHAALSALFGAIALPGLLVGLYLPGTPLAAESADANSAAQPRGPLKRIESRYSDALDRGLPPTPSPENGSDLSELDREPVQDPQDSDKKAEIVVVPIPSLNPTTGWGLAVPLMVIYKPESQSPDSPLGRPASPGRTARTVPGRRRLFTR